MLFYQLFSKFQGTDSCCCTICNLSTSHSVKLHIMHLYMWRSKFTNIVIHWTWYFHFSDVSLFPELLFIFSWSWQLPPDSGQNQITIPNFLFYQKTHVLDVKKHIRTNAYLKYVHKWKRAERAPKAFCDIFRQFFHLHVRYIITAIPTDKAQSVFIPVTQLYCLFVTFQLILYVRLFTCISNRKPVRTQHHTRCLQTGGTHSTCMACWYSHPSLLNTPAILLLPYYLMQLCLLFLCFLVVFQRNSTEQKKKIRKKEARKKRKSLRENVREKRLN